MNVKFNLKDIFWGGGWENFTGLSYDVASGKKVDNLK